jgi:hypothetical protein
MSFSTLLLTPIVLLTEEAFWALFSPLPSHHSAFSIKFLEANGVNVLTCAGTIFLHNLCTLTASYCPRLCGLILGSSCFNPSEAPPI